MKGDGVADYGTPSLAGQDGEHDTSIRSRPELISRVHMMLDQAGVDVGGALDERILDLIQQRDGARKVAEDFRQGSPEPKPRIAGRDHIPDDIWSREQEIQQRVAEITGWWTEHSRAVIDRTAPKAAEYGAADLDLMGTAMEAMFADKIAGMDEFEKAQFGRYAATAFYALGKVARIFGALERGVLPNPDSEFDLEVYTVMQARIRETGRWV